MKSSIRLKLIVFTFCIVLLVGGSISLYSIYQGQQRILSDFERDARETTTLISTNIADDLYFLNVHGLRLRLESSRTNPDIGYMYVADPDGVVLTDGTRDNLLRDQKLTDDFSKTMLPSAGWISRLEGKVLKVGGPIFAPDGSRLGYLHVGFSLESIEQTVRESTRTSFYITLICLGAGVFLAFVLATSFTRPIFAIVQASMEIGAGKLDIRLPVKRKDELGVLAQSINQMAEALQRRQAEDERKTRELQALYTLTNTVNRSLDIDACMQMALVSTIEVLEVDAGRLYVLDEKDNALRLAAHHGIPLDQLGGIQRYAPGEGIIGTTFTENRPIVFTDVNSDPTYQALARRGKGREWGFRSAAGLPITVRNHPLGVIYVYGRSVREFTPQDIELFSSIGSQIGVAIEKARLFRETEQRARQQEALNAIAMATSQSLDLKELFGVALAKTVEVTGRERVNIRLKNPLTGNVSIVAYRGFTEEEIENLRRRTRHPMSEQVFASGDPLIINDSGGHDSLDLLRQTRSVAWIPIKVGAKVVGILGISDDQSRPFLPSEVDLLRAIGSVIGVAIENARLFQETQQNLERVKALHEIDLAITSTLDLRAVLDVLLEKIDLVLPYSVTTVRLLNKESGQLEPVACRNINEEEWRTAINGADKTLTRALPDIKAPLMIRNVQTDPRSVAPDILRKHGLVSALRLPLIAEGEVLGVLTFFTKEEHEFSDDEVEFLSTLAGQAAIAIHNSRLYEQTKEQASALEQKNIDLEKSNKVKDEFLSVMSHELRTPLNVIMGYTAMMKDGLLGENNPKQEDALEKVTRQTQDQLAMVNNILHVTALEAQKVRVDSREVNLRNFLTELKTAFEAPLINKNLTFIWDYLPDIPSVKTDSAKLKHVLQNLIDNAIKFTSAGSVKISVRHIPSASAIEFKVTDTGTGISREHLPFIFDKFRQQDSSETRLYGGVGVGLYIVKKFTELLGGSVEVESEVNKGSTFTITLPL